MNLKISTSDKAGAGILDLVPHPFFNPHLLEAAMRSGAEHQNKMSRQPLGRLHGSQMKDYSWV